MLPRFARRSITRRLSLASGAVLVAFAFISCLSLWQHVRTAALLRLLHETYLPLALEVGEVKTTQSALGSFLDRLANEPDALLVRRWLNAARRVRLQALRRARRSIEQASALATSDEDRELLRQMHLDVLRAEQSFRASEARYRQLFASAQKGAEYDALLADLRAQERRAERHLREAWRRIQGVIARRSAEAAEQERTAVFLFVALFASALALGVLVVAWSRRALRPLSALQQRVQAIAEGRTSDPLRALADDELGRLTEEFEAMIAALAATKASLVHHERLAAMGRMAAHVTHEVRNPLSSIALNVELLEEELNPQGGEVHALLRSIRREVDRLTSTTEEYLRLARLPQPRLEVEDIGAIVRSVEEFVAPEMKARGVEFFVEVDAALPPVAVDEAQLRQALLNLLRNAREASAGQGAWVRLQACAADEGVRLIVEDGGSGIASEAQGKIFDLFYTTKVGGTGLGLPLTLQIVAAHGGAIRLVSTPGAGARFELDFPGSPPRNRPSSASHVEQGEG